MIIIAHDDNNVNILASRLTLKALRTLVDTASHDQITQVAFILGQDHGIEDTKAILGQVAAAIRSVVSVDNTKPVAAVIH